MTREKVNHSGRKTRLIKRGPGVTEMTEECFGVLVRMPLDLLNHLDKAAGAAERTRTAEIVKRLRESIEGESFDARGVLVKRVGHAPTVSPQSPKEKWGV